MIERLEQELRLSNSAPSALTIWLEPWAQEFSLPLRGELRLRCWSEGLAHDPMPEISFDDDLLTVWGAGGSRIAVFVNGVDQDSFSAMHAAPDAGPLGTRGFVDLVFGPFPAARAGGASKPVSSLFAQLFRRVWPR